MSTIPSLGDVGDLASPIPVFERSLRAANKSPKTIEVYGSAARVTFLSMHDMSTLALDVTRGDVEAFIEHLVATRAPATAANRFRALRVFFETLVEYGEIPASPMARMKPPAVPEVPIPVISDADLKRLLALVDGGRSFESRRDTAILRLFIDTGMRLGELANLTGEDLDLEPTVAIVMGKARRPRTCPYGSRTAKAIDLYLRARARHPRAAEPALWLGSKGAMTDSGIRQMVEPRAAIVGIQHIHPHMLRHVFAHRWLADGGNEGDLMRLAGWRSRAMLNPMAPRPPMSGLARPSASTGWGIACERLNQRSEFGP